MTDTNKYSRGSEWRKWDLHVHSPYTFMNKYSATDDEFIKKILEQNLSAIGLTNYFKFSDSEFLLKSKLEKKGIKVFLNLEFRLDYQNKEDDCLDLHVIFSDEVSKEDIEKLLQNIDANVNGTTKTCSALSTCDDFNYAVVNYDELRKALDKESLNIQGKYLIGFLSRGKGNARSSSNYEKIAKTADLLIHSSDNTENIEKDREFWLGHKKPLLQNSDAHSLESIGNKYSWVKADLTFDGLKQILYEPTDRVCVERPPEVLDRVKNNKTKYIDTVFIRKKAERTPKKGVWFDDVEINLNTELVAIIGNKGSGKSAISDIIGVLSNTHNAGKDHSNLSFLRNTKHKKFRQKGFAENFEAEICWKDLSTTKESLDADIDNTKPEKVKYIPQNYFESLTNDLEEEGFEKTLKSVIFLHIPKENLHGRNTFDELEEYKTASIQKDLPILKEDIDDISKEVISLEKRKHPANIQRLENLIEEKEKELSENLKNKPKEVKDPVSPDEKKKKQQDKSNKRLAKINEELEELNKEIKTKKTEKTKLVSEKEDLNQLVDDVDRFSIQLENYQKENSERYKKYELDIKKIIKAEFNKSELEKKIKEREKKIGELEPYFLSENDLTSLAFGDESKTEKLKKQSLLVKQSSLEKEREAIKKELSQPEREYQEYKEKLKSWEKQKIKIEGDINNPSSTPNTLAYYKAEKKFIEEELPILLTQERTSRLEKSLEIFKKKKEIIALYEEFKNSIDKEIERDIEFRKKFKMDIDVSFKLNRKFYSKFLGYINKGKKGTFNGVSDGEKYLSKIFEEKDLLSEQDIKDILTTIVEYLEEDQRPDSKGEVRSIQDQIELVEEFYSFVFNLSYLEPNYELKLDEKVLEELSPGEKGALLLVFYLMIDKEDTPLIIDQPEDNLDNKSVFEVLTHFIRFAKKRRQIIIVTHNPNLAIGADAEQIIHVNLDKKDNYKFSCQSGAIENPVINSIVVEILEGTKPAFDKRKLKYFQ